MRIEKLILNHFRNYENLSLDFDGNIHIFIGLNAQGKTNILESIYLGAMGRSHRTRVEGEMIRWQQECCRIHICFSRMGVDNEISIKLCNQQAASTEKSSKEIQYNNHTIKPRELIGSLNAVLFSPEDLLLIKGVPAGRRQFLDCEISQANPLYYRQLLKYNRIISQRNLLLKKIRDCGEKKGLLEPWDEQFIAAAANITGKRINAVKKLSMLANLMHRKITDSKENLAVGYLVHGAEEDSLTESQLADWYRQRILIMRDKDILYGSTSVGPHRDDLHLSVNEIALRNFGSQGQQRTGVLALKLAELEFIKSETGEYPVLLLDDVMSELDEERRNQLLLFIKDRVQTFITATEKRYFPEIKAGKYYCVQAGRIAE